MKRELGSEPENEGFDEVEMAERGGKFTIHTCCVLQPTLIYLNNRRVRFEFPSAPEYVRGYFELSLRQMAFALASDWLLVFVFLSQESACCATLTNSNIFFVRSLRF